MHQGKHSLIHSNSVTEMFPEKADADSWKAAQSKCSPLFYHSPAIWGVKCLAQGHLRGSSEGRGERVLSILFHPDVLRENRRNEGGFGQEAERGVRA